MQLLSEALTLDLDWTGLDGAATPVAPSGMEGLLPGAHITRSLEENKALLQVCPDVLTAVA